MKKESLLKNLWPLLVKNKKSYFAGIFFLVTTVVLSVRIPYFLKEAIDAIRIQDSTTIQKMAFLIIGASFIFSITRVFSRILMFNPGRRIEYEIRNKFFEKLLNSPLKYFQTTSIGDLMSRATNDLHSFRAMIGFAGLGLFNAVLTFAFVLVSMFSLSWKLTLVCIIPFPILIYGLKNIIKKFYLYANACQEGMADLSTKVQENFNGIHVIKSYVQEHNKYEDFKKLNQQYFSDCLRLAKVESVIFPLFRDLPNLILPLILVTGGYSIIGGNLSLGTLAAFVIYLKQLANPTMTFGWVINILQRGRSAFHRIIEVIHAPIELENTQTQNPIVGEVEFQNVSFRYLENQENILENISFKLKPGQSLGILGKTGAGKSTLVNLLMRNEKPVSGNVLLDGKPIDHYALKALRDSIGYVPQSSFLFSKTLRENIYFGLKEENENENLLNKAIQKSHLAYDLDQLYQGVQTVVGEKGVTLSGGQKQRTAISRAIIGSHQIYIFDDAFSSVDHETEEEILKNLKDIFHDKICIFISHRISTLKLCDKIIYLKQGGISERGTHEELLENKKDYFRTFTLQNLDGLDPSIGSG
ncbi:MAG: ABC transporter ATP-binding protein [Deltaproteobacteria bacterium]|nr:ABC transporter ATP-binding protein [Deltaproteobacteria bacterium]